MVFQPFEPDRPDQPERKLRRFRKIPVRQLVPNVITLLALCAGLTAIRMAFEQRLEIAVYAIVFAAILDGVDGRLARLLKGTSRFGAELDSLADFVNFGVAPALMLYFWGLHELRSVGWIAALILAICAGLRLARFNVMADDPNRPDWAGNFFVGMPAPAGAITVLLPIYVYFLGAPLGSLLVWLTFLFTLGIAFLMVSRLPVFSGKRVGKRVAPELVLPVVVIAVLFFALLISYPWIVLTLGTVVYLGLLPLGFSSYRKYLRSDPAADVAAAEVVVRETPAADEATPPVDRMLPVEKPGADTAAGEKSATERTAAERPAVAQTEPPPPVGTASMLPGFLRPNRLN